MPRKLVFDTKLQAEIDYRAPTGVNTPMYTLA